jgi:hypothetical protein
MADNYLGNETRRKYEEDTYGWLKQQFYWVTEAVNEQAKADRYRTQDATELLARSLILAHDSIIVYLGLIAVVALASARLWVGAAGVGVIVFLVCWRIRRTQKTVVRFDYLRRRLRELVEPSGLSVAKEMLPEDTEFLQRYADGILYPLTVPEKWGGGVEAHILEHIETLHYEYENWHMHFGVVGMGIDAGAKIGCEQCEAAQLLRQHLDAALSAFEAGTRQTQWDELLTGRVPEIRRAIGRHSEAMVRELREERNRIALVCLEKGNYGYKRDLVANKLATVERLMRRGRDLDNWQKGSWEDISKSELAAARGFGLASPFVGFWRVALKWYDR